jgi:hypothetical protein
MIVERQRRTFTPKEGHTKYINGDGIYVPSCTTVLKIINKSKLVYWANSLGWKRKRIDDELNKASAIGTLTHEYVERIIKGDRVDLSPLNLLEPAVKDGVINSLQSFIKWWKDNKSRITVLDIELQMTNKLFGGTCDLVCLLDEEPCIVDFKTNSDFYFTMFLQLAGYVELYEETYSDKDCIKNIAVLRMDKRNGEKATLMTADDLLEKTESEEWSRRDVIDYYISVFDKIVSVYYDLYDIVQDWGEEL